jgi:serine/threonine protein kinase
MADELMERYRKLEKIGEGTYGEVFKAQCKETGDFVALKRIKLGDDEDGIPPTALREISLLMELNDIPTIVQYVKVQQLVWLLGVILSLFLQLSFATLCPNAGFTSVLSQTARRDLHRRSTVPCF